MFALRIISSSACSFYCLITCWLIPTKLCLGMWDTAQQLDSNSTFQSEERRQWLVLLPWLFSVHVPSLALCSTSFVRRRWLITAGMIGNWPLENNLLRGLPPGHTPLPQPPSSTLPPPLTIICLICASLKTEAPYLNEQMFDHFITQLSSSITAHWWHLLLPGKISEEKISLIS